MSDAEDRKAADSAAPLDIDLYCLNCGYNLRGLPGDPIRCPECFHINSHEDLLCPPREVQRRVRKMHRCADLCVLVGFLVVVSLVGAGATGHIGCPVFAVLALALPWGICVTEFKNACLAEPGWQRTLLWLHLHGLLVLAASALLFFLLLLVGRALVGVDVLAVFEHPWSWVGVAVLAVVAAFAVAGRRYGRRADELERLAREAVRFEQEELRRRAKNCQGEL